MHQDLIWLRKFMKLQAWTNWRNQWLLHLEQPSLKQGGIVYWAKRHKGFVVAEWRMGAALARRVKQLTAQHCQPARQVATARHGLQRVGGFNGVGLHAWRHMVAHVTAACYGSICCRWCHSPPLLPPPTVPYCPPIAPHSPTVPTAPHCPTL